MAADPFALSGSILTPMETNVTQMIQIKRSDITTRHQERLRSERPIALVLKRSSCSAVYLLFSVKNLFCPR